MRVEILLARLSGTWDLDFFDVPEPVVMQGHEAVIDHLFTEGILERIGNLALAAVYNVEYDGDEDEHGQD